MLALVASVHKNSPAFCCGAEAFIAAKGDEQQKDYDILVGAGAPAACAGRRGALDLEPRPPGRFNLN